jgi:hypothetical protein
MKRTTLTMITAGAAAVSLALLGPAARGDTAPALPGAVAVTSLAAGASVTVYAWPSTTSGATLADDAPVPTVVLGTASADSYGTATVPAAAAPNGIPAADLEPDGSTMYEIDLDNGSGLQSWFGDSTQIPDAGLTPADFSSAAPPDGQAERSCMYALPWSAYGWSYNHLEHYMIAYPRPNAREYVHVWDGSAHSIQIGFDAGYGVWTGSASATLESTENAGASQSWAYPKNVYNTIDFHLYHRPCWDHPICLRCGGFGNPDFWQHEGRAEVFADFYSVITDAPRPPSNIRWCYPHDADFSFWKTQGSNETFELGTSLFGVGLHVHASYSQETTATWGPLTARVNLCGTWEGGIVKSSLVAARPW